MQARRTSSCTMCIQASRATGSSRRPLPAPPVARTGSGLVWRPIRQTGRSDVVFADHNRALARTKEGKEAVTEYRNRFGDQDCAIHVQSTGGRFIAQPFMVGPEADRPLQRILNEQGVPVEFPSEREDIAFGRAFVFLTKRFVEGVPLGL